MYLIYMLIIYVINVSPRTGYTVFWSVSFSTLQGQSDLSTAYLNMSGYGLLSSVFKYSSTSMSVNVNVKFNSIYFR